jgi:transposase-like protein
MKIPEKRKSVSKYDSQLKLSIAREYFTSDLGYGGLGKKYNIPSATIQDFIRWYKKKYHDGVVEDVPDQMNHPVNRELTEANLKITALQMLIENASEELGVDLVKKFGTKQPDK